MFWYRIVVQNIASIFQKSINNFWYYVNENWNPSTRTWQIVKKTLSTIFFCSNTSNDYLISTNCIISCDLALKIYDGNINIKHLITIYWYFYLIFCIFISNKFIHICYCLAMNDASFSFSQCSELQAITSLKKS